MPVTVISNPLGIGDLALGISKTMNVCAMIAVAQPESRNSSRSRTSTPPAIFIEMYSLSANDDDGGSKGNRACAGATPSVAINCRAERHHFEQDQKSARNLYHDDVATGIGNAGCPGCVASSRSRPSISYA